MATSSKEQVKRPQQHQERRQVQIGQHIAQCKTGSSPKAPPQPGGKHADADVEHRGTATPTATAATAPESLLGMSRLEGMQRQSEAQLFPLLLLHRPQQPCQLGLPGSSQCRLEGYHPLAALLELRGQLGQRLPAAQKQPKQRQVDDGTFECTHGTGRSAGAASACRTAQTNGGKTEASDRWDV